MTGFLSFFTNQSYVSITDIFDVIIITAITYKLLLLVKGSRGFQLLRGLVIIFIISSLAHVFGLRTIDWLMQRLVTVFFFVLIVVFQPELRTILERLGRTRYLEAFFPEEEKPKTDVLQRIIKSVMFMAESKTGALIVIQKTTGLKEYTESGIMLNADLTNELLTSLFTGRHPLHDGAVIIDKRKIVAAGCLLPLTENRILDKRLGTRHRAAIGLSEQSDAVVIVVSEETGIISIAENGTLTRYLAKETLEERLFDSFHMRDSKKNSFGFFKRQQEVKSANGENN